MPTNCRLAVKLNHSKNDHMYYTFVYEFVNFFFVHNTYKKNTTFASAVCAIQTNLHTQNIDFYLDNY